MRFTFPDIKDLFSRKPLPAEQFKEASASVAPVIWLLGKTGAGKTSLIASLSGVSAAEIGNGYVPCTRTARIYDFPESTPLIRFLDTRGLGEVGYDPSEDMQINEQGAHLVMAVMRISDRDQSSLIDALHMIRKRHRDWPILVVQTGLHDLYEGVGADHPIEYPYAGDVSDCENPAIPRALRSNLQHQRALLEAVPGPAPVFAQVDFTQPDDDFTPIDFGREALIRKLLEITPAVVERLELTRISAGKDASVSEVRRKAHASTLYFASAAAGVGAIPVVGIGTVPAAQAAMFWNLARIHGVRWDRASAARLAGYLGVATLLSHGLALGVRQFVKAVPVLIPAAAAQDFVVTYALGRAACEYFSAIRRNAEPDARRIREAFSEGLKEAFRFGARKGSA